MFETSLRQPVDRIEQVGRDLVQQACQEIEAQQHPDEPDRAARPRTDGYGFPPERRETDVRILAERDGPIGERDHRDRGGREGQAEPQQAVAKVNGQSLVGVARPHEQSRQEEERRHEKAVGGEDHKIKTEPRLGVGVAEMGVGNDGVVKHHDKRQEAPCVIERGIARRHLWRRPDLRRRDWF